MSTTPLAPIFLSLESQERIFLYLQVMFAVSCCFNALALILLVKQTPQNQAVVRKYLIAIQAILIISDVHLEIMFQPIPIFPALAGFAVGLLIRAGVSILIELAIVIVIYIYTGFVIILCLVYRHQTVMLTGNQFKFRKKTIDIVHLLMLFSAPVPGILAMLVENDHSAVEQILKEDPRNLSWIKERGTYYMQARSPFVQYLLVTVISILSIGSLFLVAIFLHMMYVLQKDKGKRSHKSVVNIRRSLLSLSAQLLIPMSLFVVPATAIFFGLLFEQLFTFETMLTIFFVLPCHSIGHNLILITITPIYRKAIVSFFVKPRLKLLFTSRTSQVYGRY